MQRHYMDSGVFIRSIATRGQSGGLPRIVKSISRALDAAGIDLVIVETVGVGQTELGIVGVAGSVLVALMPESGDAIQALKAGVMEIADVYVVNKADRAGAEQMAAAITGMLHMATATPEWSPPVLLTAAHKGQGIEELWSSLEGHFEYMERSGKLVERRQERRTQEYLEAVEEELERAYFSPHIQRIVNVTVANRVPRWEVETDRGPRAFEIYSSRRDIRHLGGGRVLVQDADGNRYEIPDYRLLEPASRALVEEMI